MCTFQDEILKCTQCSDNFFKIYTLENKGTKSFAVSTLGCKLNFSESSSLVRELKDLGYQESLESKGVDLVVVNTCAVTLQAEKKCKQTIKQHIKHSPNAYVVVTGCFSQLSAGAIADIQGVDLVLGNQEKISLTDYLHREKTDDKANIVISEYEEITSYKPSYSTEGRTRCFLKIQDGCDYFCTYCTIPLARGKSRSASIESTVDTAKEALAQGTKELNITGVNIGTFGKKNGETFFGLLKALEALEGDFRIRMGSVEPNLLTDEIIEHVVHSKKIMPHFHIPLQSGSNDVLVLMKRRYTRELFAQRVTKIKSLMPHAFIGVDVIVGMNGESDEMFEDAYEFMVGLDFSQLHVFTYSERPDTRALHITPKNSPQVKKDRSRRLLELSEEKHKRFCQSNIGAETTVIFEQQRRHDEMFGYTNNYIRVKQAYDSALVDQLSAFVVTEASLV